MVTITKKTGRVTAELSSIREHLTELEKLAEAGQLKDELPDNLSYHLNTGFYIVEDGVLKMASPRLAEITGYSADELIGRSPLSFIADEDSQQFNEGSIEVLKKKRSLARQYRITTKDAKVKWVAESVAPIFQNGTKALIANVIDITELKQTEEQDKNDEARYRDLCENISEMILCTTPSGLITYTNPAWRQTMGYGSDEIRSLSIFEIAPKEYKDPWLHLLNEAIAKESSREIDSILLSSSGKKVYVQGTLSCRFSNGKPLYTRYVLRNITKQRKEMAKQESALERITEIQNRLDRSQREFEEFIHIASHDLREPLRKISSFGALLHESLEDRLDDDQGENLKFMTDGAERMQTMINDLLAYSRITTLAKPFKPIDLNELIKDISNFELSSALEETKGKIMVPNPLLTVHGDPSQILQLLQNLIANGLKFHRDKQAPRITISSYPTPGNMVRVNIQDNGIGIDEKYHQQIFVMFKRLHPVTKYPGTGIGLAICRKIVERHGGEIGIQSIKKDGTVFWFTLPRFNHS